MKCTMIGMLLVLGLGPVLAAGSYTFTSLAIPGAIQSGASGINDLGTIVGTYTDSGLMDHGFVFEKGTYTTLDAPGSFLTSARGIDVGGDIVGAYSSSQNHGFILQQSYFINIDFPGALPTTTGGTSPYGINSLIEIVGGYVDNDSHIHGFLRERDNFRPFDVPFPGSHATSALGINDNGEIVGYYLTSDNNLHGFLKQGSAFTPIDVPFYGVTDTIPSGINNNGEIVGSYDDSKGRHGFIFANGVFTQLDASFPGIGVLDTSVAGINDLGEIVGSYIGFSTHPFTSGFLAKPPAPEFVYVANANSDTVSGFTVDATTGALTPISGSPFAAGNGSFAVAVDPTGKFAYVANETSNDVSGYTINPTTGALTPISGSPFAAGGAPGSVAVDPTGKFAYVANNGSNNVSGYTIDPVTGALTPISGSPFADFPPGSLPTSIAVDPTGKFAYVANEMSSSVSGYTIDPATGALTLISGSPFLSGGAGSRPFSVTVDPTGKFVYVANYGGGDVSGFTINPATGALTAISGSPFTAGGAGSFSVAVDPTGRFAYVANIGGFFANVFGYTINPATGALTGIGGPMFPPGTTGPVSVTVDPTGRFAYVANFYSSNVSGYTIDPTTGTLTAISGSPFAAVGSPRSVAVARPQ